MFEQLKAMWVVAWALFRLSRCCPLAIDFHRDEKYISDYYKRRRMLI